MLAKHVPRARVVPCCDSATKGCPCTRCDSQSLQMSQPHACGLTACKLQSSDDSDTEARTRPNLRIGGIANLLLRASTRKLRAAQCCVS